MLRNSAIIGCGQTKHASKRREVNLAEMVSEAAWNAIHDAELDPNEIDALIVGNMQGFGGIAQPELWLADWVCGEAKPVLRVTTGGTTGGSVGQAAFYAVASGLYDKVLAIAWEKHSDSQEPGATTGLMHVAMANFFHALDYGMSFKNVVATTAVGAAAGAALYQARFYMHRSGCTMDHFDMVAAKDRRNAARNPYAHLQVPDCKPEDIAQTEIVAYPFRYGHICPASDGASAIVVASEEVARKKCQKPAWLLGLASVTDEENQMQSENSGGVGVLDASEQMGSRMSAQKAYQQAGITDPKKEIDLAEIYQPFPSQELLFAERLGLFEEGQAWKALEKGETDIDGRLPCDLSGGVNATNAIGSSALQRILEAALQIMGKAGEHQAHREVKKAVAHGWGGVTNYITVTVLGDSPRR
ncbi:MAG: thiolase domain-containing protein [bacterium]